MSLQVLADENIPALETLLGSVANVTRLPGRGISREQLQQADALLVRSVTQVNAGLLAGTNVRFVGTATSGFDHVDRDWLQTAGIDFAYAPGSNANSVVEYVLAALSHVDDYLERLMAGGTVGIVGYGQIGKALVRRLSALGIPCRVSDPWLPAKSGANLAGLDEVLACDVICLHPELTRQQPWPSYHLLDRHALDVIGQGQLLINASRGPVIDNKALLDRLAKPSSPVAVLDVWEHEPAVSAQLLRHARLGTAHIAGYSYDGKILATRMLCEGMAMSLGISLPGVDSIAPGAESPVYVPPGLSAPDTVRLLIRSCYCIEEDDHLLRSATFNSNSEKAAEQFDLLRKHYAKRRELVGKPVLLDTVTGPQAALVKALGCIPVIKGQ
ncbi:MAG: 4-phosphoerythronate dehydrogenase [Halioglobus sp.]